MIKENNNPNKKYYYRNNNDKPNKNIDFRLSKIEEKFRQFEKMFNDKKNIMDIHIASLEDRIMDLESIK